MTRPKRTLVKKDTDMTQTPSDAARELLPCPFCGGEAKTHGPYGWYRQWCISHSCKAFYTGAQDAFKDYPSETEAITAWNTRAQTTAERERVDGRTRVQVLGDIALAYEQDVNLHAFDRALDAAYNAGRAAALASPKAEPDPRYGKVHADGSRSGGQPPAAERGEGLAAEPWWELHISTCPDCTGAGRFLNEQECGLCQGSGGVLPYSPVILAALQHNGEKQS